MDWIDTCCIDKTSSAEVSRAINAMFGWYQNAKVCFVHLRDVTQSFPNFRETAKQMLESDWFRRGWTLQELLAPNEMVFFDRDWLSIRSKRELWQVISVASKISPLHLANFRTASIATGMSWMSNRVTTEVEDMAYSLLGIFDINMDLRYGKGRKAFFRLQDMIISTSIDESIFAWRSDKLENSGLLAPWLDCFRDSGNTVLRPDKITDARGNYQLTS